MKTSLLCLVVLTCLVALASAGRRGRGRNKGAKDEGCSEWVMEECIPKRGDCGRGNKNATRTGDACAVKQQTFKCRKPCGGGGRKGCKYGKRSQGEKGDCDPLTNTRTITLTLKKGGPTCAQTKIVTKPCRQELKDGSPQVPRSRGNGNGKERGNGRGNGKRGNGRGKGKRGNGRGNGKGQDNECRYGKGVWSPCDTTTNMMNKTLTLKKGDTSKCEAIKTITKRCKDAKCTFGTWSDFGECQNGVKTKTRPVLSGGDRCQSRTSKTKPCKNKN